MLNAFSRWLETPIRRGMGLEWVLWSVVAATAYNLPMAVAVFGRPTGEPTEHVRMPPLFFAGAFLSVFLLLPLALEELVFRVPLGILRYMGCSTESIVLAAVPLSALFGYLHGGPRHILLQGVTGFLFVVLFLKGGALYGRSVRGFVIALACHLFYDVFVMCLGLLVAGRPF